MSRDSPRLDVVLAVAIAAVPTLALALAPLPARAASPARLLALCSDEALGSSAGCADLVSAIESEMAGLGVQVLSAQQGEDMASGEVPPPLLEAAASGQIAFGTWIASSPAGPVLGVYMPGSVQPRYEIAFVTEAGGGLDVDDSAFRLRALLASAMYGEVPGVEDAIDVPAPDEVPPGTGEDPGEAPSPPGPASPIEPAAGGVAEAGSGGSASRAATGGRLRIDAGYSLLGYPTEKHWYHGAGVSLGVAIGKGLVLFVDGVVTAPDGSNPGTFGQGTEVRIDNSQYLAGVGVGYELRFGGRVTLTPLLGLHLGISDTRIAAGTMEDHTVLNAALWAGAQLRVTLARILSVMLGIRVENLFNYEYYEVVVGSVPHRVFSLAQFRMQLLAGIALSI